MTRAPVCAPPRRERAPTGKAPLAPARPVIDPSANRHPPGHGR